MNIVEKLDLAIKLQEKKTTDGAYSLSSRGEIREKNAYMTNAEWDLFVSVMKSQYPQAYKEYSAGDGGELTAKNGCPPKMASYGSSSRLIYLLSREKEDFHYEKKLPTTVGGTANLDGFYEDASRYIFVEAKCREPYSAKPTSVSKSYEKLYQFINEQMAGAIEIKMTTSKCGRYLNVEYFANGEKISRFDMKQMICHLLGIATGILKGTLEQKQTDFIYLLYDPTDLDLSADAKSEIDAIYEKCCYECNLVDFAELFRVILTFLMNEKFGEVLSEDALDAMMMKFTFTLASQLFYPSLIQ